MPDQNYTDQHDEPRQALSTPPCSRCRELERKLEEMDWQNMPNRREPVRGGYEFYINEEWTCLRDGALGEDAGFHAELMKVRYDPDDERVRVRRVIDDDAILQELAELRKFRSENTEDRHEAKQSTKGNQ